MKIFPNNGNFPLLMDALRILLVDDHKAVREGLKLYFSDHPDYQITHESSNGLEALNILSSCQVDLVVTDISMPVMDGTELSKKIKNRYPQIPVIVLSMISETSVVKNLLEIGVDGYVLKDCEEEEVFKAINHVVSGKKYITDRVLCS